jgi:hypothetical protein
MKAPQMWLQTPCVYALWPLALGLPTCNNNNNAEFGMHTWLPGSCQEAESFGILAPHQHSAAPVFLTPAKLGSLPPDSIRSSVLPLLAGALKALCRQEFPSAAHKIYGAFNVMIPWTML